MFLIISSLTDHIMLWLSGSRFLQETFPDIEVPGETARGRSLSVAATQALFGPYGSFIVWFARLIGVGSEPSRVASQRNSNYLGLGVAFSPPFI